jgi:thiol-disulfide isomerase/thioredoxin
MAIPFYKGGIDDDAFFNTVLGSRFADSYANFCVYTRWPEIIHDREKYFAASFEERRAHFTGKQRDLLLGALLFQNLRKAPDNFDSVYTVYKDICSDTGYTHPLDIAAAVRSHKKISFAEMLTAGLQNDKGDSLAFGQILGKKPVIIDCWASWCKPCMEQMPYARKMEEKYGDKVDFIYLSMDKSGQAWGQKMKEINWTKKHFLLKGNFSSAFADFFNIYSIPRYIVFDKSGKVFSVDAARPGDATAFNKMMQDLVNAE